MINILVLKKRKDGKKRNTKKVVILQKVQNMTIEQARIAELEAKILLLMNRVAELEAKNALLEKELSYYRTKKDSKNSSVPPSHDPYRVKRTESLRESSSRKPGGQPGHEGYCLNTTLEPTEIVVHQPNYCQCCGKDLSAVTSDFVGKRQEIDIPPITPIVTEHQVYSKQCCCGHITRGNYPSHVHSSVCYGKNIQALTAYFHARQYLPYERMQEMYSDIFGLSISTGSLVNIVQSFADKCSTIYEHIRQQIGRSAVVGGDETGVCIKGKNAWGWVFQTESATYIHCNTSRGAAAINEAFPQGFPRAILIHDCWKPYFNVTASGHQICTSHLFRDLKYLHKLYPQQHWSEDLASLLHQALILKKKLKPDDYCQPIPERADFEEQLTALLKQSIDPKYEKLITFQERITRYRNHLFTFLYHRKVPPDNNASERAIRTFKVKQKVSGLFRSAAGAEAFAIIRSVIDTTIKNSQNVTNALTMIPLMKKAE